MAQAAPATRRVDRTPPLDATLADKTPALAPTARVAPTEEEKDKVLPLPSWLVKVYFIFPVVLYVPDAIFNYYVYSDGGTVRDANPLVQAGQIALWGFLSIGVVGMAYLLSVLAPWHWGQGHHIKAFFCSIGVLFATGITTWCSLAFRSRGFIAFPTDKWVYSIWPQMQQNNFSLTMLLVAIAPPFWGLFWAIVQPTATGRSLRQLQESHEERLMRTQQEAELKQLKAETSAKVREAQLRGMAATAASVRKQATQFIGPRTGQTSEQDQNAEQDIPSDEPMAGSANDDETLPSGVSSYASHSNHDAGAGNVLQLPTLSGSHGSHGSEMSIMNRAASASSAAGVHTAPAAYANVAQPPLMGSTDVSGSMGFPSSDVVTFAPRRPPMLGGTLTPAINPMEMNDDGMTGTTGPRPAVQPLRRSGQSSTLLDRMNGPNPEHVRIVLEAMRELNIPINKRGSLSTAQAHKLVPEVARRLDSEEEFARAVIGRVLKSEAQRLNS